MKWKEAGGGGSLHQVLHFVLVLQQLHDAREARPSPRNGELAGLREVNDGAARPPRIQLPAVKHQAAGRPQLLQAQRQQHCHAVSQQQA